MKQIFVEFLWIAGLGAWTLLVYLVAKYFGQEEAYRNGMSAGFSEGYQQAATDAECELEVETFEQIAGLWSDDGFGDPQTTQAQKDTTILPPKGEV